ncbi:MAG: SBBP repeat-containing protein, partial [Bacteroidota bacterium]
GNTDSVFVVPVLNEGDYTYIATYTMDSLTGPDIMIVKYDGLKSVEWEQTWSGTGFNRDQPSDMVMDDDYLYICGASFSSSANYNYVVMKIDKNDGTISWVNTYNGSASNYDVATGLVSYGDFIYVTGASFTSTSMTNYHTRCYKKGAGTFEWEMDFDYDNKMDIPFDISVDSAHSFIVVTGASQSSAVDWDYQTISYDTLGALQDQYRISGSGAGFDRALVVKSDDEGNVYISGSTVTNGDADDMKTVKLNPNGSLAWVETYGNGQVDIAYDLIVDIEKNVYVCGESYGTTQDFFVIKYDSSGSTLWTRRVDGYNNDDVAYKMCLGDGQKGVYVTGKGFNNQTETFDFLTVAYNDDGDELWRDYYDGPFHGNDEARNIIADTLGNVFVTGQQEESSGNSTVTIKYRTDFFIEPPAVDSPSVACMFYPNEGQLLDSEDSLITDSTHYYMLHHYPQLFFGYGVMNMVFSHVDQDTATSDTLHRVDVSFLNSTNATEAFPVNEYDTIGYLNYFLGHCPYGITANGNQKLLFSDVYDEIDAEYSSNNAGLKLTFIINPGSTDLNEIGLKFEGQTSITVLNNWQLRVTTPLGTYDFEKPKVYQLDGSNNIETLPWHLNWVVQNGNEAVFSTCGSFDNEKPLIIEISRSVNNNYFTDNLKWSTFYGGGLMTYFNDAEISTSGIYITGDTEGPGFPTTPGVIYPNSRGGVDAVVVKLNTFGQSEWATFLGGSAAEESNGIAIDNTGNIYVSGNTFSSNFPTVQGSLMSNANFDNQNTGSTAKDIFISKISSNGRTLIWSTFYGADQDGERSMEIELDDANNLWIVGIGGPNCRVVSSGVYNESFGGGLILKMDLNGNAQWITKFGSSSALIESIAFDSDNNPVICGSISSQTSTPSLPVFNSHISSTYNGGTYDGFVNKFDGLDNSIMFCTYLGSSSEDEARSVKVDANDNIVICGRTDGTDFFLENEVQGTNNGSYDAFVTILSPTGNPIFSDYYGGSFSDQAYDLDFDDNNNILIVGDSYSSDFPIPIPNPNLPGGYYNSRSGQTDNFIIGIKSNFVTRWATHFGGNDVDQANSCSVFNNCLYVIGGSSSSLAFPLNDEGGIPYFDGVLGGSFVKGTISKFDLTPFTIDINEAESNHQLILFPNPASSQLKFELPFENCIEGDLEVIDILGNSVAKEIKIRICRGKLGRLQIENFKDGLYFINFKTDKRVYTSKFIVIN